MLKALFLTSSRTIKKYKYYCAALFLMLCIGYYFILPNPLFNVPYSTVLFDKNGALLGARIAKDGQWRFDELGEVPYKFEQALITFEDKRFYSHLGVDFWAIGRAFFQNISAMSKQSGASTLTMQVMRLAGGNNNRNIFVKILEIIQATRLEWSYSKKEILQMYAMHAPFGGNIVGLEAASWKYFKRAGKDLSWAEAATLAVLPNAPSLIHMHKNRALLQAKRDRLLDKLYAAEIFDKETLELSKLEDLPPPPQALPQLVPHILDRVQVSGKHAIAETTIDANIQKQVSEILKRNYSNLAAYQVHNAAAIVVDVESKSILAYVGNIPDIGDEYQAAVDIVQAPRSSGSILKPFLYAAMLTDGECMPEQLYADIPTNFGTYTPKNFNVKYSGAASARTMIERSLNIPSIYMLNQYGVLRFMHKLQNIGMTTLKKQASHYGLTLILGGAETKLIDLATMYSGMARSLLQYNNLDGKYDARNYQKVSFWKGDMVSVLNNLDIDNLQSNSYLSAGAIWHTFEAMQEVIRPEDEGYWRAFNSSQRIAWKTGTSFGFRDAWAVGSTPRYVVAVWAGNATGEGRPGLIGVRSAAPILFDIFSALGTNATWFDKPYDDMKSMQVCKKSGMKANPYCKEIETQDIVNSAEKTTLCKYHQEVFLSPDKKYRASSECFSPYDLQKDTFFILPAAQAYFYKQYHFLEKTLPPYHPDCQNIIEKTSKKSIAFLYPHKNDLKIYLPKSLDEEKSMMVCEVAQSGKKTPLFWHLDNEFLTTTTDIHKVGLQPNIGKHTITVVNEDGESISYRFEIVNEG